jgi:hypothetical protein
VPWSDVPWIRGDWAELVQHDANYVSPLQVDGGSSIRLEAHLLQLVALTLEPKGRKLRVQIHC